MANNMTINTKTALIPIMVTPTPDSVFRVNRKILIRCTNIPFKLMEGLTYLGVITGANVSSVISFSVFLALLLKRLM